MGTTSSAVNGKGFSWKSLTLFLMTICAVLLCLLMAQPFLPAVTGAVVLAVITQRPYTWLKATLKQPTLIACTSVVVVSIGIIGPAFFLAHSIGSRVFSVVRAVQTGAAQRGIQQFLDQSPRISAMLQYFMDKISLEQAFDRSAGFIATNLTVILGGSVNALTQAVIMLFLLFYIYRDEDRGLSYLRSIMPLHDAETSQLFTQVADTIRATVLGHLGVAIIQGFVAGIVFAILGISEAVLLGIVTVFFAMVPSFGAFVVWVPIAIYLVITHHWVQAAFLLIVGSLVISTLDNFLYPVLVGTQLRLHTVPVLLSILGGIWLFGITGLVLGPVVFALATSVLDIWHNRTTDHPWNLDQRGGIHELQ